MARKARLVVPGVPMHVMAKGVDGLTVFPTDESKLTYLAWLRDAALEYQLDVHAYVLMPNYLHLLATPSHEDSLARVMQSLGRRYTQNLNQHRQQVGTIWSGRFLSSLVDPQEYLLVCQKYIELRPMVEGLVSRPEDYPWSSYRIHVGKEANYGLKDAPAFWNLGNTPFERQMNWKIYVDEGLTSAEKEVITNSLKSGLITGHADFLGDIKSRMVSPWVPQKRGRPKKVQ